jgi:putative sterol carrier protein
MTAMAEAANADDGFRATAADTELRLQFDVNEVPDGDDIVYTITIDGGQAALSLGENEEADATITNSYETATAISKGDLNTQMAFMTGKLKVGGNMAKVMMNQGLINQFSKAVADVDVDY